MTNIIADTCKARGIVLSPSPPHEKNFQAIAERANRTVGNGISALLYEANMRPAYCIEAARNFIYIKNRTLSRTNEAQQTPYEQLTGNKPRLGHVIVFGCDSRSHTHEPTHYLSKKSERCILLGYNSGPNLQANSYRLLSLERPYTIVNASSVSFNEQKMPWKQAGLADYESEEDEQDDGQPEQKADTPPTTPPPPRRSGRTIKPTIYPDHVIAACEIDAFHVITNDGTEHIEPTRYEEAITCEDKEHWQKAMESEIRSLKENGTWQLVTLPLEPKPYPPNGCTKSR